MKGCNNSVADIVFVVDGSGSIGYDNFDKVKIFLKKFIAALNIGPDPNLNSRISVVQFSGIVQVEFKLNDYSTLEEYQAAIGNIVYLSQGTQTDKALDYLATQSFLPSSGARPAG
ncbi:hypothetical protein HELRODRAFT_85202 [Helobdella robusta]|uniref:VWFA domain-containing protein n=1 Tax=Helobdella robusta TaxID=6412 RepID=T1G5U3_HELRO|nr:hypothetical protein HELRODRAFT_85202 [Helobdella robusta]ESN97756.1 hypothetical protein HELRODRAFT_85202 [Helobdella robusta]